VPTPGKWLHRLPELSRACENRAHQTTCARKKKHAYKNIERRVLSQYGATRLQSGEVQLKLRYLTDQDLNDLRDDLLFEIAREAQMRDCFFSETEVRLECTDRRW
jgi:hypothetical protein